MILKFNNTPIYYEKHGKGPALFLIHGYLESSTMWGKLISILATRNTIVSIDLPGFGKSGCLSEVHSMELMAEVVHKVLEEERFDSATIMGHSMGGYVALAFAEIYPHRADKLILLNSTAEEDSPERKINRDRSLKVISKNPEIYIKMAIDNLFVESTQDLYASEIEKLKKEALNFPVEGIKAAILGMKIRKNRISVLKNFRNVKIMICGIQDPLLALESSKNEALQTNTHLILVSGGHMGMIENFDQIVKIFI
jgi:pimeloyl-ACP methyl ester carboxylesterase